MNGARIAAVLAALAVLFIGSIVARDAVGGGFAGQVIGTIVGVVTLFTILATRAFRKASGRSVTHGLAALLLICSVTMVPAVEAQSFQVFESVGEEVVGGALMKVDQCYNPFKGKCWKAAATRFVPPAAIAAIGCGIAVAGVAGVTVATGGAGAVTAPVAIAACAGGVGTTIAVNGGIDVVTNLVTGDLGDSYAAQTVTNLFTGHPVKAAESFFGTISPSSGTCADKMARGQECSNWDGFGILFDAIPSGGLFKSGKGAAKAGAGLLEKFGSTGGKLVDGAGDLLKGAGETIAKGGEKAGKGAVNLFSRAGSGIAKGSQKAADLTLKGGEKLVTGARKAGTELLAKGAAPLKANPVKSLFKAMNPFKLGATIKHGGQVVLGTTTKYLRGTLKTISSFILNGRDNQAAEVDPSKALEGLDRLEFYCSGRAEGNDDYLGWTQEACKQENFDYLECLVANGGHTNAECDAILTPFGIRVFCEATHWEFCEDKPEILPEPGSSVDMCLQFLGDLASREFCNRFVQGTDVNEQFATLIFDNVRPAVVMSENAKKEGDVFTVAVSVDRGAFGVSCQSGDAARFARLLGYCLEKFTIAGITATQTIDGAVVDEVKADRESLIDAFVLDTTNEKMQANFPYDVAEGESAKLGLSFKVFYQVYGVTKTGDVKYVAPKPAADGSSQYYTREESRTYDVKNCGGSDCSDPTPDPSPGPTPAPEPCEVGASDCDDPVDPAPDPAPCNSATQIVTNIGECTDKVDEAIGGAGLGYIVKYWWVALIVVAGTYVFFNGNLYVWTDGKVGRKPKSPLQLTKKNSVWATIKAKITGLKPKPKLRDEYRIDGVPVVVPPNKDGTGPDYDALRKRLKGDDEE